MAKRISQFQEQCGFAVHGDCPFCGWGLPGPHEPTCAVLAALLEVEAYVPRGKGRSAILRLVEALNGAKNHVGDVWKNLEAVQYPYSKDPIYAPMTVTKVGRISGEEILTMSDGEEWSEEELQRARWVPLPRLTPLGK